MSPTTEFTSEVIRACERGWEATANGGKSYELLFEDHAKPGRQDVKKTTDLEELRDVLSVLDPPGRAPVEFIAPDAEVSDYGTYVHNEGREDGWSLTWPKVDVETGIIDRLSA